MSDRGEDRAAGFAAESLKGTGLKPGQSGGLHAEAGDGVASHRSLTGHDTASEEHTMTKNIPGTRTNPEGIPQEGHGGSNKGGTQHTQGKDGNGAQKRQQQKK
ncbi:MAG TPA: hypothetical protein VIL09_16030 [Microvirga sp.]|jgi:hypothetical protein